MEAIRKIDIFHSPNYDVAEPTHIGGALSLTAIIFCAFCFFSEIGSYRQGKLKEMVYLENEFGGKSMVPVFMDITINDLKCEHVTLDIQDGHGRYLIDEHSSGDKKKEDHEQPDVEKKDTDEGGCQFSGYIHVRHMKGNFHFTPRGDHHHPNTTISHKITSLRFGDELGGFEEEEDVKQDLYIFNTLAHEDKQSLEGETHDYLVKLVRTELFDEHLNEHQYPYQYTYSYRHFVGHHKGKPLPPRIFFRLDFSPLTMKFTKVHESFLVFISRHLALIGGTFAVLKMFYNGAHVAKEGKFQ